MTIYTVAVFLRNCHVCMYGGQSSNYFGIKLSEDMFERYLQMHTIDKGKFIHCYV